MFDTKDEILSILIDGLGISGEALTSPQVEALSSLLGKTKEDVSREFRDNLLSSCDWTQVADAPVDKAAWATYRQALRDVPSQAGFPHDIVWPTKPEGV